MGLIYNLGMLKNNMNFINCEGNNCQIWLNKDINFCIRKYTISEGKNQSVNKCLPHGKEKTSK